MVSFSVQKLKKFFTSYWLLVLLFFTFLLRLPLIFEPFTYGDEGIYLTLGQGVRKGLTLYRDIHDNKPPLLYLMAAISQNFTLYRFGYLCWSFITLLVFYQLAKLLLGKSNKKGIFLSTASFAILTSLPMFEGNIANAENFMILPIMAGFYLIIEHLKPFKQKGRQILFWWFLSGVLFSLAALFKIPAIFDFAAAFCLALTFIERKNIKKLILFLAISLLGFLIPLLISFLYFYFHGSFWQYFIAAFAQNLPYLSSWSGAATTKASGLPLGLLARAGSIFVIFILVFLFRKKISLSFKVLILWFAFSLFAALLSARPYPHYLIQSLPPFCLALGLIFLKKFQWEKLLPIIFLVTIIISFVSFRFWYYPNWAYYKNFYQYALQIKDKNEYFYYFNSQAQAIYQTADFIKNRTSSQEKIFIWGTQPSIYALANRLPVGRYTVSYHIIDFDAYKETMKALNSEPPQWLIVTQDEKKPFPDLDNFIKTKYVLFQIFGQFQIFYQLPKIAQVW